MIWCIENHYLNSHSSLFKLVNESKLGGKKKKKKSTSYLLEEIVSKEDILINRYDSPTMPPQFDVSLMWHIFLIMTQERNPLIRKRAKKRLFWLNLNSIKTSVFIDINKPNKESIGEVNELYDILHANKKKINNIF